MSDSPDMPWVVKLRDNTDAKSLRILNDGLDLRDSVNLLLGEGAMEGQVRERLHFPWEAIIVCQVPVEHIEFGSGHGIQELKNSIDRVESARCVKHVPSVEVPGEIGNLNGSVLHLVGESAGAHRVLY